MKIDLIKKILSLWVELPGLDHNPTFDTVGYGSSIFQKLNHPIIQVLMVMDIILNLDHRVLNLRNH